MSTFWATLLDLFYPYLEKTFGTVIANIIKSLLEKAADNTPDPQLDVAVAPPDVKDAVRRRLVDLAAKALAGHPIILKYVSSVINGLPLDFLDQAWDTIFAVQIAAGLVCPQDHLAAYPVTATAPAVVRVSSADKALVEAEASKAATDLAKGEKK